MIKHKVCIRDILKIKSFGKTTKSINAPEVAYHTILGDAERLFNIDLHIWRPHWSKLNHCCNSCPTQLSHSCLIYPFSYIIYVVFVDEYHKYSAIYWTLKYQVTSSTNTKMLTSDVSIGLYRKQIQQIQQIRHCIEKWEINSTSISDQFANLHLERKIRSH